MITDRKRLGWKLLLTVFLVLPVDESVRGQTQEKKNPVVRVAVIRGVESLSLRIKGEHRIFTLYTDELLSKGRALKRSKVVPTMEGLRVGDREYKIFGIKIVARKEAAIYLDDRLFRGQVDLIRQQDMTLLAINHVGLEDYLRGVIPAEISSRWPLAALKAQAVAARTYAYYQMGERGDKEFDLVSTVFSQLYQGRRAERRASNRAVAATRGEVLAFKGKLVPAFYHACCGGRTENATNVWPKVDLPPLKGRECGYCRKSPHYYWRRKISLDEIRDILKGVGYHFHKIFSVAAEKRDEWGRVITVKIPHTTGTELISGNNFRLYLGPDLIKSTNFSVEVISGHAEFSGRGWGHGVGLCQWGAYYMAKERKKYREILEYYYPGAQIVDVSKAKFDQ